MTDLQARAEAAADPVMRASFLQCPVEARPWMVDAALRALTEPALQSEGWGPISEAIDGALMMEVVDHGRWSLRFDFGEGDDAHRRMLLAADAFRVLPAPPEGGGK